jgi:uncharacterized membrane protein
MTKIFTILIIAAIIESIGVAFLSGGLKEIKGAKEITVSEIVRVLKSGVTNGKILLGVTLEAVFFGCLLYMMSLRDMSFVWPLTSLGFIFTTLAAQFILHESVSAMRWVGVVMIAVGAALTGFSEAAKGQAPPPAAPLAQSATLGPQ